MKLPDEIAKKIPFAESSWDRQIIETIVRDCAKVCSDGADKYESPISYACAKAILARYGLEKKR